ncbi:MAG TPA: hypothetical protein VNO22_17115 [Planctomycetota bacterium]|nr:hypothetical protein [Planctomycetota bacterium]
MKGLAAVLLSLSAAGCVGGIPEPDARMAGGDGELLAQLREGRRLYVDRCSGCHALFPVDRYSDEAWVAEVEEMTRLNKVRLKPSEKERLLLYLRAANGPE